MHFDNAVSIYRQRIDAVFRKDNYLAERLFEIISCHVVNISHFVIYKSFNKV